MATENDKVNTGALATLVAVGTASMIGICLAVNALVRHEVGSVGAVRDELGENDYRALKAEQLERLSAPPKWSDPSKGQVSIPIERAMGLVLTDLKRSPWNATPAPPLDAGTDAATESADAAATAEVDAGGAGAPADGGTAATPEPPAPAPLSPSSPTATPSSKPAPLAPGPGPSAAPAPKPKTPAAPTAAPVPPPAPPPPAPPAPPATP